MNVEFDISCKVNLDVEGLDRYNIKNITNEVLVEKLKKYLEFCALTCENELSYDGYFDNIEVNKISFEIKKEIDNTLEEIASRKFKHKKRK